MRAEGVDVCLIDLRGEVRQLDGELAEGALARWQPRPPPVVLRVLR
jgi:hypothetical protein